MTLAVDWAVKPQHKQTNYLFDKMHYEFDSVPESKNSSTPCLIKQ